MDPTNGSPRLQPRSRRLPIKLLAILAVAGQAAASPDPCDLGKLGDPPLYDIVLANGRVIDPETQLDEEGYYVGIKGDRIAAVSPDKLVCNAAAGCRCIDVESRVIAPGFIDLHAHGMQVFAMRVQAFDGVTTALELESGLLPIEEFYQAREGGQPINYGASAAWTFARIAAMNPELGEPEGELEYFAAAQSKVEWKRRPAGPHELQKILGYLKQGLAQGAVGIGMNAGYAPGYGAEEAAAIHRLAARYGVRTFYHLRGTRLEPPGSAMESVEELVGLAESSGSQIHIHHINSSMRSRVVEVGEKILKAREQGFDISTDAYPYGASSTVIGAESFADTCRLSSEGYDWKSFDYLGEPFCSEQEYFDLRDQQPGAPIVWHFFDTETRDPPACPRSERIDGEEAGDEAHQDHEDLFEALSFADAAIASDGMPWTYVCKEPGTDELCPEPPEPPQLMTEKDDSTWPFEPTSDRTIFAHPRSAGAYSRILSKYVSWDGESEPRKLAPLEAIRKLTLIPAQILEKSVSQMANKGRLQVGKDADIVVFSPDEVEERATFKAIFGSPWDQESVGMRYVLVNGKLLIDGGNMKQEVLAGRPVRRTECDLDESEKILIKNVDIFDGRETDLKKSWDVLVVGKFIQQLAPDIAPPACAQIIEGITREGAPRVLMPGLIDAHVHVTLGQPVSQLGTRSPSWAVASSTGELHRMLMRGFTTVRDASGADAGLAMAVDGGLIPGPRLFYSGRAISQTSGHGDSRLPNHPHPFEGHPALYDQGAAVIADGVDEVTRAVREELRRGATQIKVMAGGGVSTPSDPIDVLQYSAEELRAAVVAAEDWGTYVMAHAYTPEAIRRAVEAGVKGIEHGHRIDEKTAELLAAKEAEGVYIVPHYIPRQRAQENPKLPPLIDKQDAMMKWLKKHQVRVGWGTDLLFSRKAQCCQSQRIVQWCGNGASGCNENANEWWGPKEILRMMTSVNGEILALSGPRNRYDERNPFVIRGDEEPDPTKVPPSYKLGVIEEGAWADLLLVKGNPLEKLEVLTDPESNLLVIMKGGRIYKDCLFDPTGCRKSLLSPLAVCREGLACGD